MSDADAARAAAGNSRPRHRSARPHLDDGRRGLVRPSRPAAVLRQARPHGHARLLNNTAFPHSMHLHGHHFRLLDRLDDGWKPFWLDTVVVPTTETVAHRLRRRQPGQVGAPLPHAGAPGHRHGGVVRGDVSARRSSGCSFAKVGEQPPINLRQASGKSSAISPGPACAAAFAMQPDRGRARPRRPASLARAVPPRTRPERRPNRQWRAMAARCRQWPRDRRARQRPCPDPLSSTTAPSQAAAACARVQFRCSFNHSQELTEQSARTRLRAASGWSRPARAPDGGEQLLRFLGKAGQRVGIEHDRALAGKRRQHQFAHGRADPAARAEHHALRRASASKSASSPAPSTGRTMTARLGRRIDGQRFARGRNGDEPGARPQCAARRQPGGAGRRSPPETTTAWPRAYLCPSDRGTGNSRCPHSRRIDERSRLDLREHAAGMPMSAT